MKKYEDIYKDNFSFGENWGKYLKQLTPEKIKQAQKSIIDTPGASDLRGKTFLDLGCGSGLFSLAAYTMGAKVVSVDVDDSSISCTRFVKDNHASVNVPANWVILKGSVLDKEFMQSLGKFDYVYAWGSLHHTGDMWQAIDNACELVNVGGTLHLAIYNRYEGFPLSSAAWVRVKWLYNKCPGFLRWCMRAGYAGFYVLGCLVTFKNPFTRIKEYGKKNRGMSWRRDIEDWLGGYPYEFASVKEMETYFARKNVFKLVGLKDTQREGCNEFLFWKNEVNQDG